MPKDTPATHFVVKALKPFPKPGGGSCKVGDEVIVHKAAKNALTDGKFPRAELIREAPKQTRADQRTPGRGKVNAGGDAAREAAKAAKEGTPPKAEPTLGEVINELTVAEVEEAVGNQDRAALNFAKAAVSGSGKVGKLAAIDSALEDLGEAEAKADLLEMSLEDFIEVLGDSSQGSMSWAAEVLEGVEGQEDKLAAVLEALEAAE